MSTPRSTADTAFRVAERLKGLGGTWDVFAERTRSYELHFDGSMVNLARGPLLLEGYGLRLLQPRDGKTAIGFQASTDATEQGVRAVVNDAESVARFSEFPAKGVELPSNSRGSTAAPEVADPALWSDPAGTLAEYSSALFAAFEGRKGVALSFGSVKARLVEVTIANSSGLEASYTHTLTAIELAVKASGGPEGSSAGEYWWTSSGRRFEPSALPRQAEEWSRYARDARGAQTPPTGEVPVVLPPAVLESILPQAMGFKLSGRAELRQLSPAAGSRVGVEGLTLIDDGSIPWAAGSSGIDDEGTPQRGRTLVANGVVSELLYDALYGNALGHSSTGSGARGGQFDPFGTGRFTRSPAPSPSTLVIRPGGGGTDDELIEAAGDGIWVQQIGWSAPNPVTTTFGGEIRIGYRIRNGKLAEPVRGGTLGGVALAAPGSPSLLANIAAIGSRPELAGGVFVPSLLVRSLTVAGNETTGPTAAA